MAATVVLSAVRIPPDIFMLVVSRIFLIISLRLRYFASPSPSHKRCCGTGIVLKGTVRAVGVIKARWSSEACRSCDGVAQPVRVDL